MGAEQVAVAGGPPPPRQGEARPGPPETVGRRDREPTKEWRLTMRTFFKGLWQDESGTAAAAYDDRKSVVEGKRVAVRVELGVSRIIEKKNHPTRQYHRVTNSPHRIVTT